MITPKFCPLYLPEQLQDSTVNITWGEMGLHTNEMYQKGSKFLPRCWYFSNNNVYYSKKFLPLRKYSKLNKHIYKIKLKIKVINEDKKY